jgi:DNA repair protein RadD
VKETPAFQPGLESEQLGENACSLLTSSADSRQHVELRPYQVEVIDRIERTIAAGTRRLICVSPTGSGKTIIAGEIIRKAVAAGQRVLVLSHRIEIIKQTSQKLYDIGVDHGIIQAGFAGKPDEAVQVASVNTLWVRAVRMSKIELPPADLFIIDECHHSPAKTYKKIIEKYPDAVLIGLTATPCRGDGRGLGGIFDRLIECPQVPELIEQKFLMPTIVYAPAAPDLAGVETQNGDYVQRQLETACDRDDLVGDIVTHWHKYAERRRTVCFATGVRHSLHIASEFEKAGVRAAHIDAITPKPERDAILTRLAAGELDVVTNAMVLTEGWDAPAVSCCILARPTRKMGLYRQMVGRVLRPAADKPNAIVIDHSGATHRHGFVEDRVTWTLAPDRRATAPAHTTERSRTIDGYTSRLIDCSNCGALRVHPLYRYGKLFCVRGFGLSAAQGA